MKILFLSQLVPYPINAGPKVRSYYVLRYLAEAGHEVTLAAFRRESDTEEAIEHLSQYCSAVHTVMMHRSKIQDIFSLLASQVNGVPFLIRRDSVAEMHQLLKDLMARNDFDAVHVDQLWMAQYALGLKDQSPSERCLDMVLDQHNAVFLIPQRLAADTNNPLKRIVLNLESRRLAQYEAQVCSQFNQVVWVTLEDQQAVRRQGGFQEAERVREQVIPICVDAVDKLRVVRGERPFRITFLGGLHWPPNAQGVLWFAANVFSQVRAVVPDVTLTIIGKDPPAGLTLEGVEVTGYVEDLQPLLRETAVFIVPLLAGGGMRVKILDAWNWGLPIISTTIGAEGISAVHEENMLIADSPEVFAQATIRLLKEPELAEKLVNNGRQTLNELYNWQTVYRAWDSVYPNG